MTSETSRTVSPGGAPAAGDIVISVDAMGGDRGVGEVVRGMDMSLEKNPRLRYILHGDAGQLEPVLRKAARGAARTEVRHAPGVVAMDDKPSRVLRNAQGTSMMSALDAVKAGESPVVISCGNTGALMALAMLSLRKAPGVNRPAIACLWPSRNPQGFNVMLDCGADIRADAQDLITYALMGASYARNGLGLARPRVGLLNVGTEDHKGRPEMKQAHELMPDVAETANFDYVGFVEGGDLPSSRVDVIVTDGFTGNVALKTGEGTAKLVSEFMREAFSNSILSKFAALLAMTSLKRLQKRMDPRRQNGGIFLGLNGTVVKSHGSADATGISAAIKLAAQLGKSGFQDRLAARVAQSAALSAASTTNNLASDSEGTS